MGRKPVSPVKSYTQQHANYYFIWRIDIIGIGISVFQHTPQCFKISQNEAG